MNEEEKILKTIESCVTSEQLDDTCRWINSITLGNTDEAYRKRIFVAAKAKQKQIEENTRIYDLSDMD